MDSPQTPSASERILGIELENIRDCCDPRRPDRAADVTNAEVLRLLHGYALLNRWYESAEKENESFRAAGAVSEARTTQLETENAELSAALQEIRGDKAVRYFTRGAEIADRVLTRLKLGPSDT